MVENILINCKRWGEKAGAINILWSKVISKNHRICLKNKLTQTVPIFYAQLPQ